jgi:hypothetical protein
MTVTTARVIVWLPRIIGIAVALFIGMFALDAFSEGKPWLQALGEFAIHLAPSALLLLAVAIAWRHPMVGAVTFAGLGIYYAVLVQRLDWIVVISGPLLLVGVLFIWSRIAGATAPARRA